MRITIFLPCELRDQSNTLACSSSHYKFGFSKGIHPKISPRTSDQLEVSNSHFHLAIITPELSTPNISFQNILDYNPSNYVIKGAVAKFVYPMEWPSTQQLEAHSLESRLGFIVGIHPHKYADLPASIFDQMQFLAIPKVVAVGKCGLDYSASPELPGKILQLEIFLKQLSTAREK